MVMNQLFTPEMDAKFLAMRKSPEEEFFMMLLMTYKLNHPNMNKICDVISI
jgi:hypothetical protein